MKAKRTSKLKFYKGVCVLAKLRYFERVSLNFSEQTRLDAIENTRMLKPHIGVYVANGPAFSRVWWCRVVCRAV